MPATHVGAAACGKEEEDGRVVKRLCVVGGSKTNAVQSPLISLTNALPSASMCNILPHGLPCPSFLLPSTPTHNRQAHLGGLVVEEEEQQQRRQQRHTTMLGRRAMGGAFLLVMVALLAAVNVQADSADLYAVQCAKVREARGRMEEETEEGRGGVGSVA